MVAMSEVKRPSHVFRNLNIKKEKLDHVKTSTPQQLSDHSRFTRLKQQQQQQQKQQKQQQQQQALEEQQQNDGTKTSPSVPSQQQWVIPVSNETEKRRIGKKNSFQCNLCNKVVSSADSLKRHVKGVHLKQTARMCDLCKTSFSDAHSLKRHKNSVHKTK
jgi:transcription initiation factor TFIID subunit TAF12